MPRLGARGGPGRAPFGAEPGVLLATSLAYEGGTEALRAGACAPADSFSATLRLADAPWSSAVSGVVVAELAVVWAAEATGCAEQLLRQSVEYAKIRQQFGKPIGSFQAIKHRLADMRVQTEAAETATLWGAVQHEQARRATLYALDTSVRVAESAIQVHGGIGFTWELGLHHHLRHVLMLRELVHGLWS